MEQDQLTSAIIGAAIEVHKTLGPGLLESAYEKSLAHELELSNLIVRPQFSYPLIIKE
jgi:GxxExxY protein